MAFWDTNAIVPLCVARVQSQVVRQHLRRLQRIVVWWGTPVEARSAFTRLLRDGHISKREFNKGKLVLEKLSRTWGEVLPAARVREIAVELPDTYGLRALDSFQLAAALVWTNEKPRKRPFVCFDSTLALAAEKAGFDVLAF